MGYKDLEFEQTNLVTREFEDLRRVDFRNATCMKSGSREAIFTLGVMDDRSDDVFEHYPVDAISVCVKSNKDMVREDWVQLEKDLIKALDNAEEINFDLKRYINNGRPDDEYPKFIFPELKKDIIEIEDSRELEQSKRKKRFSKGNLDLINKVEKSIPYVGYRVGTVGEGSITKNHSTPCNVAVYPNYMDVSFSVPGEDGKLEEVCSFRYPKSISSEEAKKLGDYLADIWQEDKVFQHAAKQFYNAELYSSDIIYDAHKIGKAKDNFISVAVNSLENHILSKELERHQDKNKSLQVSLSKMKNRVKEKERDVNVVDLSERI